MYLDPKFFNLAEEFLPFSSSQNVYKSDLQWLRGIGWVPIESVDVIKCKRAAEILSDKLYRQPPDTLKFTSVPDSLEQVLAKNNAINMNKVSSSCLKLLQNAKRGSETLITSGVKIVHASVGSVYCLNDILESL